MLVQRCSLEQNRLILLVSVTKPAFDRDSFYNTFSQGHYRALVDTGAQRTVLSRLVIGDHKLVRTGHMQFASLHGPRMHSRYLAGIAFWVKRIDGNNDGFEDAELSLFSVEEPFEVVDMDQNSNFDMILGFDVLKAFSFRFDAAHRQFEIVAQT